MKEMDISEIMDIPKDYYILSEPKFYISKQIEQALNEKEMSLRQLAKEINMHHPQIVRVTSIKNYNIDTLLRILDGLDLEIVVKRKNEEKTKSI